MSLGRIQIDCHAINTSTSKVCGKPAKARITGNQPVCGIHARSEEQRGGEVRPLHGEPVLTVVEDAAVEPALHERVRAVTGKGAKTSPADLVQGQVVRVDGTKYLVHRAERSVVTGSIMVEVLDQNGEWDVLSLGATALVPVIGSLA